jgi:mono/diheme cytochrome c family protein
VIATLVAAALAQAATPSPAPVAKAQSAQDVWDKRCVFCHGADGKGKTKKGKQFKAPDFTSAKFQQDTAEEEIEDAIANGVPKSKMPAFKGKLSDAEIQELVKFVRAFGKNG